LPPAMQHGRALLIDRRINRWMATVNAVPGGLPQRSRTENHLPDPARLPGLLTVGDYMFDATLNGVLDSADTVTDLILSDVIFRRRAVAQQQSLAANALPVNGAATASDNELVQSAFEGSLLADLLSIAYGVRRGGKILCAGSGSVAMVAALRALGYEAWGIDGAARIHRTGSSERGEPRPQSYNLVGDLTGLPFRDGYFDVVVERALCHLPRNRVAGAIMELRRVARRGVILGSVTTDLAIDLLERYDLVAGVATLASRWDWSDLMFAHGFDHALNDPARLARAWKRAEEAGAGLGHWYEDAHALLYCVYQVADMPAERREPAEVVPLPRRDVASRELVSYDDDRSPAYASVAAVSP